MTLRSLSILVVLCVLACRSSDKNGQQETQNKNEKTLSEENAGQIKTQFEKVNQQLLQKENDEMDAYEKSHKISFVKTGSGVRYFVYKHSEKGDSIKSGTRVNMNFTIKLLDGTECYNSRFEGLKSLVVAQEEAESGLHRGLQHLKKGDKALLLIPSSLAHGLLGDLKKIPPQMPIVYDVHVF